MTEQPVGTVSGDASPGPAAPRHQVVTRLVRPPVLDVLQSAHAARDWPTLRGALDALPTADDRSLACFEVAGTGDEDFYRSVVSESPDDPLAMTLLGTTLLVTGWDIRGGGRANTVSREQFTQFHDYARHADAVLIEAVARQPQRAEAWTVRVTVARALSLSPAEARRRYLHAAHAAPHMVGAQRELLKKLLPKWSGSWEAADEFVHTCTAEAPLGAPNSLLIAELHLERGILDLPEEAGRAYFADPRVRADIVEAAHRGPLAGDFRPGLLGKQVCNLFAMTLALIDEHDAAAVCFRMLDGRDDPVWPTPWQWLGEPAERFAHYRDRSLAQAGS